MTKEELKKWRESGLREKSGDVWGDSYLTLFIYILMRDHMPPGNVESIVRETIDYKDSDGNNQTIGFTNGWLAHYAQDVVNVLLEKE